MVRKEGTILSKTYGEQKGATTEAIKDLRHAGREAIGRRLPAQVGGEIARQRDLLRLSEALMKRIPVEERANLTGLSPLGGDSLSLSDDSQRCALCGRVSLLISAHLGVCGECIRCRFEEARPRLEAAHAESRRLFGLPGALPQATAGLACPLCAQNCVIGPGQRGYCGLRVNRGGRLVHLAGTPARGVLHWYRDPLPTNCVADWVCAGHRQAGYHNLAMFYASCTINCLYCQNWHFREVEPLASPGLSARQLANYANSRTFGVYSTGIRRFHFKQFCSAPCR